MKNHLKNITSTCLKPEVPEEQTITDASGNTTISHVVIPTNRTLYHLSLPCKPHPQPPLQPTPPFFL